MKAPFPYFGGKGRAASLVWQALGDPAGYVEPFAGSAAVLLGRPAFTGRRVETLNDADGWLVNAWRSIQLSPADVAASAYAGCDERLAILGRTCCKPCEVRDTHKAVAWEMWRWQDRQARPNDDPEAAS